MTNEANCKKAIKGSQMGQLLCLLAVTAFFPLAAYSDQPSTEPAARQMTVDYPPVAHGNPPPEAFFIDAPLASQQILPNNWQQMKLADLATAASTVDLFTNHATYFRNKPQWIQVSQYLWTNYLSDDQRFNQLRGIDRESVIRLIGFVGRDWSKEMAESINSRLMELASSPSEVAEMDFMTMADLQKTMDLLGISPSIQQGLISTWIKSSDRWQNLMPHEMAHLAHLMAHVIPNDHSPVATDIRQKLPDMAWSQLLSKDSFYANESFDTVKEAVEVFAVQLDPERKSVVREKLINRYNNSKSDWELITAQHIRPHIYVFRAISPTDEQVADVLVMWSLIRDQRPNYTVNDGGPRRQFVNFVDMTEGSTNSQSFGKLIQQKMAKNGGIIGPTSAGLMTYAKLMTNELHDWDKQLVAELDKPGLSGDERATLLIARAMTKEWAEPKAEILNPVPLAEKALAVAETDKMKLYCTYWVTRRLALARQFEQIKPFITDLRSSLKQPPAVDQLNILCQNLVNKDAELADLDTHVAQARSKIEKDGYKAQLSYYQNQLTQAKASHRSDRVIQSIETLIANTQQMMESATTQPST